MDPPAFRDLFAVLQKLETTVNRFFERKDIAQDNKKKLRQLQSQYRRANDLIRQLEGLSTPDFVTRARLSLYCDDLQQNSVELNDLQSDIDKATVRNRVRRMEKVLKQCETDVKELFQFLTDNVSPTLRDAQNLGQDEYLPDNNVPPNPPRLTLDYSTTTTCEGRLKNAILDKSENRIVAVLATGRGGVGKTCALRGLASDKEVKKRFPGGTLYIQLCKDARPATIIQGIASIVERTNGSRLAEQVRASKTLQEASDKASIWFRPHNCLFLVDDIWWLNGIDSSVFTLLGTMVNEGSRLVYTTRDMRFLGQTDKRIEFSEKKAHGELARRMLMRHAGFGAEHRLEDVNKNAFESILHICQGLPLALGIAGGSVWKYSLEQHADQKQNAWSDFHRDLLSKRKDLLDIPAAGYGALTNIVDVSLEVLEMRSERRNYQKLFRAFCVVQKQQCVPLNMLKNLWDLESLAEVEKVVEMMKDVSLLQVRRESGFISVQLHDLILNTAVRKASEEHEAQMFFRTLIHNYIRSETTEVGNWLRAAWWNTGDDGYIHNNLCRALRNAGYVDELLWLLSKPQWIVMRLQNGGISVVEQDLEQGTDVAGAGSTEISDERKHLEIIGKAARMSWVYVNNNPYEAWFQMHGRLLWYATQCEKTRKFVEEIERSAPRPWAKASVGFLQPAGGAMLDTIPILGHIIGVSYEGDEIVVVEQYMEVVKVARYNLTSGTRKIQDLSVEGDSLDWILDVNCCAFSLDQRRMATGHRNGKVVVWNTETGAMMRILGHQCNRSLDHDCASARVLGKQGVRRRKRLQRIFACCGSEEPSEGALSGEAVEQPLTGHTRAVACVVMSADGTRIVSGSRDGTVRVWDALSGEAVGQPLMGHMDLVYCVAMSRDGTRIVSGSGDETVRVWDALSGEAVGQPLTGHTNWVYCVAMSADGTRIVSGSGDETVRVWDALSGEAVGQPLMGHTDAVACVAMSADGTRIVSGSGDETVRVWDALSGEAVGQPLTGHTYTVECVAMSADETGIAIGSLDKIVRAWIEFSGGAVGQPLMRRTSAVRCVAMSADGTRIVSGSQDETVRVWDALSGEAVGQPLTGHTGWVESVAMSADGTRIVSGSWDNTVRVWDALSGEAVGQPLTGHTSSVECVVMSVDGTRIVSGSWDNTVRVWDALSGEAVGQPLTGHTGWVECVAMSADGTRIVSGSRDNTVRVWDALSGEAVGQPLTGHTSSVECVVMSVDGTRIVSGSWDNTVRVWDALSGEAVGQPLTGHTDSVVCVAMSADGTRIVSGSWDNTVRVWDALSGRAFRGPFTCDGRVTQVGVDAHGSRVESREYSGLWRLWDVSRGECVETSDHALWQSTDDFSQSPHSSRLNQVQNLRVSDDEGRKLILATVENAWRFGDTCFSPTFSGICRIVR